MQVIKLDNSNRHIFEQNIDMKKAFAKMIRERL